MKHCLIDGETVCFKESTPAQKIGFENKNLWVFLADITVQHCT